MTLMLAKKLSNDEIGEGTVGEIEQANDSFLPSYLGMFFVASSIPNYLTFAFAFSIIAVFVFFSRSIYFNPMYFLFGYRFYNVKTEGMVRILIISRKKIRRVEDVFFKNIKRINDFTFIDLEE